MARLDILEYPDPRLRRQAEPVRVFDASLDRFVTDLVDTLHGTRSIGLSAPQVDDRREVVVMDHSGDGTSPEVYINPEILSRSRFGFVEERCLSVPGVVAMVFRATRVQVRARDVRGAPFERALDGMPAVCLLHELDHLRGKLLVDRLWWWRRWRVQAAARRRISDVGAAAPVSPRGAR